MDIKNYIITFYLIISVYLVSIYGGCVFADEYNMSSIKSEIPDDNIINYTVGNKNVDSYYESIKIPAVVLEYECSKNGKTCWGVIVNNKGKKIKTFPSKHTVRTIALGRYSDNAFLLIQHTWKSGEKDLSENIMYDQNGKTIKVSNIFAGLDRGVVKKNKSICFIFNSGFKEYSTDGSLINYVPSPELIDYYDLKYNPKGSISAIAIGKSNKIMMFNQNKWIYTDIELTQHGDRKGIFSCFPKNDNVAYGVVYKYVSAYDKGIYLIKTDFSTNKIESGSLFLSKTENIGFYPDIHLEGDVVVVNTENSSNDSQIYFSFPEKEYNKIIKIREKPPKENKLSLLLSGGFGYQFWKTNSEVKGLMTTDYSISDNISTIAQFEGKYDNFDAAVSYLSRWAKDQTDDEAAKQLIGMIDINDYLSNSSVLRLRLEVSELNGEVEVTKNNAPYKTQRFKSKYYDYSAMEMKEKGQYWGVEYINYSMPCALGFAKNGSSTASYAAFDDSTDINVINLMYGYDMLSYCKRYETDYDNFYVTGNAGLGIGWINISDSVRDEIKTESNMRSQSHQYLYSFSGKLEIGYVFQRRSKSLNGLGYNINPGYMARGAFMGSTGMSQNDDELKLIFQKYDIYHGPFITVSIIY